MSDIPGERGGRGVSDIPDGRGGPGVSDIPDETGSRGVSNGADTRAASGSGDVAEERGARGASDIRIGQGYDVHPLAEGRALYLGGIHFPDSPWGLVGHSDADVLLHAICDALLGAAGMGDIGKLFPPSDDRHKDRRSTEFLAEVKDRLDAVGWRVGNVDATVLAEAPKIGPRVDEIKACIAAVLGVDPGRIGIKATTNEGLGFIGRGEGMAAHATALLFRT